MQIAHLKTAILDASRSTKDVRAWAALINTPLKRGLEFGHSGWVNPEGCQRVAGGRRGFGGGDLRTTAQETRCTPAGVPDSSLRRLERAMVWQVRAGSGTPPGCSAIRRGFPVVVPPLPRTTTGYHLPTLQVGFPFSRLNVRTPGPFLKGEGEFSSAHG